MHGLRRGMRIAVLAALALAPCCDSNEPAAPRVAIVDTSAYGPVLALHGPNADGELLVLCSTAVLEFDPRDRSLVERVPIEHVFTSEVGAFLAVDGTPEPWCSVAGMGGVIVQDLAGAVHYRVLPRQVGELSASRSFPSAERGGPEVVVEPSDSQWMSVRLAADAKPQRVWLPGRREADERDPERARSHGALALRTQLMLEQAPVAGYSGAFVRVEARDVRDELLWSDELRCDPERRPFPTSIGAVRVVELDGRGLAVVGCSAGLALYDLGPKAP